MTYPYYFFSILQPIQYDPHVLTRHFQFFLHNLWPLKLVSFHFLLYQTQVMRE